MAAEYTRGYRNLPLPNSSTKFGALALQSRVFAADTPSSRASEKFSQIFVVSHVFCQVHSESERSVTFYKNPLQVIEVSVRLTYYQFVWPKRRLIVYFISQPAWILG